MDSSEEDNNYSEEVVIINDPVTEASHPNNLMESDSESNLADDELSLVSSDYDVNEIAISTPPDMVVDGVEAPGEQERGIAQLLFDYFNDVDVPISDDSSSSDDDGEPSSRIITFDQSTPSAHMYLGNSMEDVQGRTLFDEETVQVLPAYMKAGVVLMPGQTLPLVLHDQSEIDMMKTALDEEKTLAILHHEPGRRSSSSESFHRSQVADIGTTAQVLSMSSDRTESGSRAKVITKGRQRFTVINVIHNQRVLTARVKILTERTFGEPLQNVIPFSHYKSRVKHNSASKFDNLGICTSEHLPKKPVRKHTQCANFTAWPDWVYSQYSPEGLMCKLRQEIRKWGDRTYSVINKINCPDHMAYWLADNIPITDVHKLQILSLHSSIQRLRLELHLIQNYKSLTCRNCNTLIAKRSDIFSLSFEGPMGTFVNPHGCVHETLTLRKAKHLSLRGRTQTEFSWYPGYAWTVVNCVECGSHKGWRFTSNELHPPMFYGLTRNGLNFVIRRDPSLSEVSPETFVF